MCRLRTFVKPHEGLVKCVSYIVRQRFTRPENFSILSFVQLFSVSVYLNKVSVCDQGVCYPEEIQKCVVNIKVGV